MCYGIIIKIFYISILKFKSFLYNWSRKLIFNSNKMFEINVKSIEQGKWNTILKKNINLDEGLDCFILVSSPNAWFAENVLNNALEHLIEKISKSDTYNDFSICLENINAFIKTWRMEWENRDDKLDMLIWILNEDLYTFSNLWNSSAYLINKNAEIVELTDAWEYKREFSYISSWKLVWGEIVVSSTIELLNFLSKSDLIDGLILSDDIEVFNRNIQNILESEILESDCLISSLKIIDETEEEQWHKSEAVKEVFAKAIDNKFSKKVIWFFLFLWDKIKSQSKTVKNVLLLACILLWIFVMYLILSKVINSTTNTPWVQNAKESVIEIREKLRVASENINNTEIFEKNIVDAEALIKEIESQKLFLNDLAKITDDLNLLKQQFNKIEIFNEDETNLISALDAPVGVKLAKWELPYIIDSKSVIWPIVANRKAEIYTFSNLWDDEEFVDWVFIWTNLYILTNKSKIVRFAGNWYFEYTSVIGQNSWEETKAIWNYAKNLYTLWADNQINRHLPSWNDFRAAEPYLKQEDLNQIWEVLSMAIDWWFYLLKKDLTVVKFFSNPYRLEWIVLNKLPENYTLEEGKKVEIKARDSKQNYVYILLNNKIWVFKPNSVVFTDTKSLTYMGQIEWATKKIKDFYVNYDWEILILNDAWVYKLNFEISDDKIILR